MARGKLPGDCGDNDDVMSPLEHQLFRRYLPLLPENPSFSRPSHPYWIRAQLTHVLERVL